MAAAGASAAKCTSAAEGTWADGAGGGDMTAGEIVGEEDGAEGDMATTERESGGDGGASLG